MLSQTEHAERLALYNQKLNDQEIADKLYLGKNSIFLWRKKYKLPANGKGGSKPVSPEEHAKRVKIYENSYGLTHRELGKAMGLSINGFRNWLYAYKAEVQTHG